MATTVLILEDDPHTVEVVQLYLRRDGHTVLSATDGIAGLSLAREAQPDLIVLDLMLPGMDGVEVCRNLRRVGRQMPVMMVTAVRMTMVVNRCGRQRDGLPAWHELRHQQPEAE